VACVATPKLELQLRRLQVDVAMEYEQMRGVQFELLEEGADRLTREVHESLRGTCHALHISQHSAALLPSDRAAARRAWECSDETAALSDEDCVFADAKVI
jgi:hypothetical protein